MRVREMDWNPFLFMDQRPICWVLTVFSFSLIGSLSLTYGYDPLDPNGNITIKWDVMQMNEDTQDLVGYTCGDPVEVALSKFIEDNGRRQIQALGNCRCQGQPETKCVRPDDTGMFYGIRYYNDMLLQSGYDRNIQTEMVLYKDTRVFTFREGWAFPRKISFNGDDCVMPSPDDYPRLPNNGHLSAPFTLSIIVSSLLLIVVL
ncbi:unnamed protein product [Camellia sinensis]